MMAKPQIGALIEAMQEEGCEFPAPVDLVWFRLRIACERSRRDRSGRSQENRKLRHTSRPEIQQNDLAAIVGQADIFSMQALVLALRRRPADETIGSMYGASAVLVQFASRCSMQH